MHTNTKAMEPTTVSGVKTWSDDNNRDGVRPESIEIQLLADGQPALDLAGKPVKSLTVKGGSTAKTWSYEFTNIPKHRTVETGKVAEKAEEIVYTVKEVMSDALKTNKYVSKATDMNVTNSREIELTQISGIKTWSDDNNRDGVRPESIEVQLLADGKPALDKDGKEIPVKEVKGGNTAQEWTYEFKDLPKHKAVKADEELVEEANRAIVYTIKEVATKDLEAKGYTVTQNGMNVTNSRSIELTKVSGEKYWNDADNQDGIRPEEITINLLADGEKIAEAKVSEATEWKYEFTNLPVNKVGKVKQAVVYTVEEEAVEGYEATEEDNNFTNTHKPEEISILGVKSWKDGDNQDNIRPEKIKVNLLSDEKEKGKFEVIKSEVVTAKDEWKYEFNELPKYLAGEVGREITYTVEEEAVDGYEATITETETGFDILNSHQLEMTTVSGTKTWKDADNKDGIRPTEIIVNLFADGEKVDEVKVTEKSDWKYEFKDLPVNKSGKKIKYSVTENKVDGYETTIDGFNITNTHTPKEVPTSGGKSTNNKSNNNKSGYLPKTGEAETTALVNLGVTMIVIFLMSHIWLSQRRTSKED
ncbi:Cna B-type domain-containing protein [Vagococcus fluvialis]|uniref:Cna B-type domain-containing protein n=1 Tax=Vagococcus fluvialis TaxID=2738 RepID=UPI001432C3CA|nr:Cna B-type domain-containing protein [Vagococcus fluvialis]MBO0487794.1 Cna B-type domain-containing protein [Vagococcus fluvialis]NKC60415.1 Cna B-type domain-containing protein [Vagococcus fluvialis]NKD51198.1 Cna B-type domain-containing protein [Vagococcus fluvialis]